MANRVGNTPPKAPPPSEDQSDTSSPASRTSGPDPQSFTTRSPGSVVVPAAAPRPSPPTATQSTSSKGLPPAPLKENINTSTHNINVFPFNTDFNEGPASAVEKSLAEASRYGVWWDTERKIGGCALRFSSFTDYASQQERAGKPVDMIVGRGNYTKDPPVFMTTNMIDRQPQNPACKHHTRQENRKANCSYRS